MFMCFCAQIFTNFYCYSWRSVSMDATANNQLPTSYSGSFEMNANQLSSKIASQLSYNMDTKSFAYSLNTPFETVNSLEMSATMKPRINTYIKLNGENMFTLTGNAQVESLTKHNIDLTVTYPFWNEFIRFKVCSPLCVFAIHFYQMCMNCDMQVRFW